MNMLTPTQAGAWLNLSPRMVSAWANEGRIPEDAWTKTPGGRYRFKEPHIRLLANQMREGAEVVTATAPAEIPADVFARNNRGGRC